MKKQFSGGGKIPLAVYRRFAEFQLFRSENPKRKRKTFYFSGVLLGIAFVALGLTAGDITAIFIGGLFIVGLLMFSYMTKRIFARQCRMNADQLEREQSFVFAPDGLVIKLGSGRDEVREDIFYPDFYRVYEVKDAFYIYLTKKSAFIIPKSNLESADGEQAAEFLRAKLPAFKYIKVRD